MQRQLRPEARHRSRRLELGLDAVGDRNIFSGLLRSACSTTCCKDERSCTIRVANKSANQPRMYMYVCTVSSISQV